MHLDRRTVGLLLVGGLAALSLAVAAATLADPTEGGAGGSFGIEGNLSGLFGSEERADPGSIQYPAFLGSLLRIVVPMVMLLGLAVAVVVLDARDVLTIVVVVALLGLGIWLLVQLISLLSGEGGEFGVGGSGVSLEGGEGGLPAAGGGNISPLLLGGIGLVGLFALIALFALSTDESTPEPESEPDEPSPQQFDSVGRAAGRAADHIAEESLSASNAVYRAWVEMTGALDGLDRRTTTPGEFAEAAIATGMDADDVRELTRLFEDVRYGDEPVTDDRIERARAALRRIESTAGGESE